jgi:hypothetical protein
MPEANRPGYLPEYSPRPTQGQPTSFAPTPAAAPGTVLLGPPQFEFAPQATIGPPIMMPGFSP